MNRSELTEKYLDTRFPTSGENYRDQWRDRFDRGEEWNYSDFGGRAILQTLAPDWYPADVEAFKVLPPYPEKPRSKDANDYAETCFRLACHIVDFFDNDPKRNDLCIRYNPQGGAYVSIDSYNKDIVLIHQIDIPRTNTRGEMSLFLQQQLTNKPFFPTA